MKLEQVVDKFRAFGGRIENERAMLEEEVSKLVLQMEFETAKKGMAVEVKPLESNYFKQQFKLLMKPCQAMKEKLETQLKVWVERLPQFVNNRDPAEKRPNKKKKQKKQKRVDSEDDDFFLD